MVAQRTLCSLVPGMSHVVQESKLGVVDKLNCMAKRGAFPQAAGIDST